MTFGLVWRHNVINERTSVIRTHCKGCVFKIEKDNVQTGCKLNRLNVFLNNGTEVECVDGSYIIKKLCSACRDAEWAKDKDDIMHSVRLELEPRIDYIVICDDQDPNIDEIKRTIYSIEKQQVKPHSIIVSVRQKALQVYEELTACGIKAKVTLSLLADYRDKTIDACVRQCNGNFYTWIDSGKEIDQTWAYAVNLLINEKLENFVLIEGNDTDFPPIIFSKMHSILGGNRGSLLIDKIKALSEDQKSNMTKKWIDVINSLR